MKKHLMIGVFAASVAFTFNVQAAPGDDFARGKSPLQAVSTVFDNRGRHDADDRDRGRGKGLAEAIREFKEQHDHRRGELGRFIAYFKDLVDWHKPRPGGPSPC